MTPTRGLLNAPWHHHSWHSQVTSTEHLADEATNMWGRVVSGEHVICHKQVICSECGEVRGESDCLCDLAEAERCRIRLDLLEQTCWRQTMAPGAD